jgi:hypothetical protein
MFPKRSQNVLKALFILNTALAISQQDFSTYLAHNLVKILQTSRIMPHPEICAFKGHLNRG